MRKNRTNLFVFLAAVCILVVFYMTGESYYEDLAREAAKYAVEIGSGKEVSELEGVTEKVNDGTYEIPARILEPTAVTMENIDEVIIDGGFHRRDEVYLNADYN